MDYADFIFFFGNWNILDGGFGEQGIHLAI